jgi:hypothetical protein
LNQNDSNADGALLRDGGAITTTGSGSILTDPSGGAVEALTIAITTPDDEAGGRIGGNGGAEAPTAARAATSLSVASFAAGQGRRQLDGRNHRHR